MMNYILIAVLLLGLLAVVTFYWRHAIALRAEGIRSIAVVMMMVVLAFCMARLPWPVPETWSALGDPYFLLAVISQIVLGLIAWGANYIKAKIAGQQIDAGLQPTGNPSAPLNEDITGE